MRIHITGASGAGVTTLGAALGRRLGVPVLDGDDFYWVPTEPPFTLPRPREERLAMALAALARSNDAVFSGSCLDWGSELEDSFDLVVFLYLDAETRIERLKQREYERCGDVSDKFLEWASQYDAGTANGRSLPRHRAWLAARRCPVLELHGDLSVDERVSRFLDALYATSAKEIESRWDDFYLDRSRRCGFFGSFPDENLVRWVREDAITPGCALDVGCGNGRNAVYLARNGFKVEGVDLSATAIEWASVNATAAGVEVAFSRRSAFELQPVEDAFDLVYDSGCFHHLWPHQRKEYVDLVARLLKPGGMFGLVCFRPEGGSGYSDEEVRRRGSLGGGLGYTEDALRAMWSALNIVAIEQMAEPPAQTQQFGEKFLWTLLAQKPGRVKG